MLEKNIFLFYVMKGLIRKYSENELWLAFLGKRPNCDVIRPVSKQQNLRKKLRFHIFFPDDVRKVTLVWLSKLQVFSSEDVNTKL